MNQSCQAVSEEIRETTKKAKEAEEAAKAKALEAAKVCLSLVIFLSS